MCSPEDGTTVANDFEGVCLMSTPFTACRIPCVHEYGLADGGTFDEFVRRGDPESLTPTLYHLRFANGYETRCMAPTFVNPHSERPDQPLPSVSVSDPCNSS